MIYVEELAVYCHDIYIQERTVSYLTPVVISLAASFTTSSVKRFRKPSSSSFPYKPQAEYGGSSLFNGKAENGGRLAGLSGIILVFLEMASLS